MRLSVVFIVLTTTLLTENIKADKINLAPIIELGLRFLLLNIKRVGSIILTEDYTFVIPEDIKNISTGSINFKDAQIYGFQTLDITKLQASDIDTSDSNSIINVCVNLLITQLGLSSNYDADAGIINEIPIYGDGKINLALSDVIFDLCLNIDISEDFSQLSVDNVALSLQSHDSPSYITRFWKNESVSNMITAVINILEKVILMWLNYEKECLSCVLNPVIQYVVNSKLPNNLDNKLVINCKCLQELLGEKNDVEGILEKLVTSYQKGNLTNLLRSTNAEHLRDVFQKIEMVILQILQDEGINKEA